MYPERLLVYHVGTGKTTIIGFIKVSTILAFAVACLVAAPAFYNDPASPWWAPPAGDSISLSNIYRILTLLAIAIGAIPMIFVASISAPFVSTIHLRLPPEARLSKERLMRYTQLLPPGALLEITAMRFLPWPKRIGTRISELRPFRSPVSIADIRRVPQKQGNTRNSWSLQQSKFYVGEKEASKRSRAPGAWDNIMQQLCRHSAK